MNLTGVCCPDCHHGIEVADSGDLFCNACQQTFVVKADVPVLTPANMHEMTASEATYWDWRAGQERDSLAADYARDFLNLDTWGLYGYKDQFANLRPDARILEVGCGTHPKAIFLARFRGFCDITVSDLSPAQLIANRAFCTDVGLDERVRHIAADLAALPFRDDEFDVIFVHAALHHVPDVNKAISEMVRCLHPQGRIVIGHEPNRSMIRLIRGIASKTRLGEKRQAEAYSIADDELEGLSVAEITSALSNLGVTVSRVDRQWFLTAFVHPLPLAIKRLTGKSVDIPRVVIFATTSLDRFMARIPVANRLGFHFSVIGQKGAS